MSTFAGGEELNMAIFEQTIMVRWADLDPNGHVRHSVYYDYGAQVRINYLHQQGCSLGWMFRNRIGPVLFREEAKFYREVNSGDELVIDMRLTGLSADYRKWSIRHQICREGKLCASLDLDGAWLDLRARTIMVPPQEIMVQSDNLERTDDFKVIASGNRH